MKLSKTLQFTHFNEICEKPLIHTCFKIYKSVWRFREDIQSAEIFKSEDEKENYYRELKSAAESGWDFSSRWFILNGTNKGNFHFEFIFGCQTIVSTYYIRESPRMKITVVLLYADSYENTAWSVQSIHLNYRKGYG